MIETYPGCEKCPLADRPPVIKEVPTPKRLMIIGEAPGREEAQKGIAFVGKSGQLVWKTLEMMGVKRSECFVTNIVVCHPLDNVAPGTAAIEACRDRLYEQIRQVRPEKILLLGSTASKAILNTSITKIRGLGQMLQLDDLSIYVVATYHPSAVNRDADLFRDFASDIEKWVTSDKPMDAPKLEVVIPTTLEDSLSSLHQFWYASSVSCDIETTGLSPRTDKILSIGFGAMIDEDSSYNVIIPKELVDEGLVRRWVVEFFREYEGNIVFHNIKFDMSFFRQRYGREFTAKNLWDTMLMRYAQDERGVSDTGRTFGSLGLKDIARVRYDLPDYGFDFKTFFSTPEVERDWEAFYRYQAIDTHTTIRLFYDLRRELEEESPRLIDLVRNLLIPGSLAFCNVEMRGFPIDVPYLQELKTKTEIQVDSMADSLRTMSGKPSLNPNSPKQIKEIFTENGVEYVSGEKTVLQMMMTNAALPDKFKEFIPALLDFRQRSKVLKTYIEGLLNRVDDQGRVHSTFKVTGTDTGRMSSANPNLQNIPTILGPEIKRAFIAPEGWTLINADYSQLELRVAAYLSKDENLIAAYLKNVDVHRWVASLMFDKPPEEITSFERYLAKYSDFGALYGRHARSLTEGFEAGYITEMTGTAPTLAWAEEIQRRFFEGFPGLVDFINSQHRFVREHGYIESLTGRRRRFPFLDRSTVGSAERKSVNTPIQGLASDMTLNSIIVLDREFDPDEAYVVSSVHDSIMVLSKDECLDRTIETLKRVMSTPVISEFDVPIRADVGFGKNWSEAKD